nr:MAG TPA: hypothetical protein [Caudoviricetes sp.]
MGKNLRKQFPYNIPEEQGKIRAWILSMLLLRLRHSQNFSQRSW